MNYKHNTPCPKCGGPQNIINLEEDGVSESLLICIDCQNNTILRQPYEKTIKEESSIYFSAKIIHRYGLNGRDSDTFLNVPMNRNMIFVFGDNLIEAGKGGQAMIRDEINAFGVPTKRLPSMTEDSFFSDKEDEREVVLGKLRELYTLSKQGKIIVFPFDGLGTGLAEMHLRSPTLFKEMNDIIYKFWNVKFKEPEINIVQNSLFQ